MNFILRFVQSFKSHLDEMLSIIFCQFCIRLKRELGSKLKEYWASNRFKLYSYWVFWCINILVWKHFGVCIPPIFILLQNQCYLDCPDSLSYTLLDWIVSSSLFNIAVFWKLEVGKWFDKNLALFATLKTGLKTFLQDIIQYF